MFLLARDNCTVAVKFKSDQTLYKTPIIICSNNIFLSNDEFHNRLLSYRWFQYLLCRLDEIDLRFTAIAMGAFVCWPSATDTTKHLLDFETINKLFLKAKLYVREEAY